MKKFHLFQQLEIVKSLEYIDIIKKMRNFRKILKGKKQKI